jgi:hypothetical protein
MRLRIGLIRPCTAELPADYARRGTSLPYVRYQCSALRSSLGRLTFCRGGH